MAALRNIHITVAYDGSPFVGFQRQLNGMAVQEVIEDVLQRILGQKTTLYFVARTDSGVHAWAQECTFYTTGTIPGERFASAMNALLPPAVRVRKSCEVPSNPVRTIYDIHLEEAGDLLKIYVTGDGFLYKMVRNIVGALVDCGRGRKTPADLVAIGESKDRRLLGMTAPAQGLCLLHVYFDAVTPKAIAEARTLAVPLWQM